MEESRASGFVPVLTPGELNELAELGARIQYKAGSTLLGEGEETKFVLLLLAGHVKVVAGPSGRIITVASPGEVVGEMSVITQKPRFASAFALTDVEALYLAGSKWLDFLYKHPRAMHGLIYMVDERLENAARRNVESYLGAEQKTARALVELESKGLGEHIQDGILIRFSQKDLAAFAGVSRESISQVVGLFKKKGYLQTGRQSLTIHDLVALKDIANGDRTASG